MAKIRSKKTGVIGSSSQFNVHGIGEIIVAYEDGDMDSCFIKDFDVFLQNEWIDLSESFRNHLLITDNYNTIFFEPRNEEEKIRGFST
jgi:hypothetical protein